MKKRRLYYEHYKIPCRGKKTMFDEIFQNLPLFLTRKDIAKYLGNYISPRYLANLDSQGKGPEKVKIGNKVAYPRDTFKKWFECRASSY